MFLLTGNHIILTGDAHDEMVVGRRRADGGLLTLCSYLAPTRLVLPVGSGSLASTRHIVVAIAPRSVRSSRGKGPAAAVRSVVGGGHGFVNRSAE